MSAVAATFNPALLAGCAALAVGRSGGIGAAIGNGLAAVGASVTVTGAPEQEVDAARAAPTFAARDARVLDVRSDDEVRALMAELPRLDVLVNCAGIIRRGDGREPAVSGRCSR